MYIYVCFRAIFSQNNTLKTLLFGDPFGGGNQIGDNGAIALARALTYDAPENFLYFIFICLDIGQYLRLRVLFCSQNSSLKELQLWGNQIGDAGASGIGAGLAYVAFSFCG